MVSFRPEADLRANRNSSVLRPQHEVTPSGCARVARALATGGISMRSFSGSMRGPNTYHVPSTRTARCWTFWFYIALRSPHCAPQPGRLRDEPRQPLRVCCRRWCHVFRPPGEAAISAAAPERLEKVPVLEERPAATGTYKARHSASSPGNRGHPGERNEEKRRVLEKQVVQQISKEKHSRNATEEQKPKSRRPAIQIAPCRVERKTGGHIKSTWGPSGPQDARKCASINIFAARAMLLAGPRTPRV